MPTVVLVRAATDILPRLSLFTHSNATAISVNQTPPKRQTDKEFLP